MTDWDTQSITTLILGITAVITLWGLFLWSISKNRD